MKNLLINLEKNTELQKAIKATKNEYYNVEDFLNDSKAYIKAIKEKRMICIIESVSSNGMSRVLRFVSCEKSKNYKNDFYYRNYTLFFKTLGYTEVKNSYGFRVNGCGMDMIFNTNYCNINDLKRLKIVNDKQAKILAQITPTKF
jgi:hypothetical protein